MSFLARLAEHFPGALPEASFVHRSYQALLPCGFSAITALACTAVCRDELTRPLVDDIERAWGRSFNFSSLAGMVLVGKTGFHAAHHHAPLVDGRERYVYYALPHIAISREGEPGRCYRAGRAEPSQACGALIAFQQQASSAPVSLEIEADDLEQSLLCIRLSPKLSAGDVPDLIALTKLARECIEEDLEHMIRLTVDPGHSDYAVFSGIQVHGPDGLNYVWPVTSYVVVGGRRTDVSLA